MFVIDTMNLMDQAVELKLRMGDLLCDAADAHEEMVEAERDGLTATVWACVDRSVDLLVEHDTLEDRFVWLTDVINITIQSARTLAAA